MKKLIIHLSDLHFRQNWEEDQGLVLEAFFEDLVKQIRPQDATNVFIAFSGDVVLSGGDPELYNSFFDQFDYELNKLKIFKNQRICVPGNHDVSINFIKEKFIEHEGVVSQELNEKDFNDYILKQPRILFDKFDNYIAFKSKFADYGISGNTLSGSGFNIDENTGVYCLNTALCSSGGIEINCKKIDDKERLAIDTRSLQKWICGNMASTKILIMHHPIEWLTEWAQIELKKYLRNNFSLCLSGHIHDQSIFHSISEKSSLVECSAPPLLTNKKDNLGYAIISISENGINDIQYRQWTKYNSFVIGVNFSNTDDGKLTIMKEGANKVEASNIVIENMLKTRLDEALRSFASQPIIWVEPVLSKTNEKSRNAADDDNADNNIVINDFVINPKSTIIKAPPQFGLTCLAHYLAQKAWTLNSSFWLYLDAKSIKSSHRVDHAIKKELEIIKAKIDQVNCIILDSWINSENDSQKLLKNLSDTYKEIPIIVMQTIDDSIVLSESNTETIDREFDVLYLLDLSRGLIRKVVSAYNNERHIGDEEAVVAKVVTDLEVLNIYRTPLNCLTLLKVLEKYFDESPINRTKLLEMVLFLLFNMDDIPTYKAKPDLKDCEYILGCFCEKMFRTNNYSFSREDFLSELKQICAEKLIDLEVDVVFDVLYSNNIIVKRLTQYNFRYTYWIYYFAAKRMHQDQNFANYIFEEKRYVSFPEIIEFYTGIDRSREDALKLILKDIQELLDLVVNKVGLPDTMNPYKLAQWLPTHESIIEMQKEIGENVLNSKLPVSVKDQYADRDYDQMRPHDQSIHAILYDYSCLALIHTVQAASRALRNSDYVNPEIKRELLNKIMHCWAQISKIIIALTPFLALKGYAAYEGTTFVLVGNFGETFEERINQILCNIPNNVVSKFKNDLFSCKMGPLLFEKISIVESELIKHELILLLILERPRDWKKHVEDYIISISKNSYYLFDVVSQLRIQYRYSFASQHVLKEIEYLIKMGLAKHEFGTKKPLLDKIIKISNKVLPKRIVDEYPN